MDPATASGVYNSNFLDQNLGGVILSGAAMIGGLYQHTRQ